MLETEQVPAGQLLLEVQWSMSFAERYSHAIRPHMNETLFRTLVVEGGSNDLNTALPEDALQAQVKSLPVKLARKMIRQAKERIAPLYDVSQTLAQSRFDDVLANSVASFKKANDTRIERLKYLAKVNPIVTEADVSALISQTELETQALQQCEFVTSGVRLILCAPPGSL